MSYECGHQFPSEAVRAHLPENLYDTTQATEALKDLQPGDQVFRCERFECPGVVKITSDATQDSSISSQCPVCYEALVLGQEDYVIFKRIQARTDLTVEQKLDAVYLERKTKSCPWCHSTIERTEGCPHMSCTCGKQFCWDCGGKYRFSSTYLFGKHHSKWNINGCPRLLMPQHKTACKVTRGALFAGRMAALVTLGPPVVVGGLLFVGIPYGVYKGCKKLKNM